MRTPRFLPALVVLAFLAITSTASASTLTRAGGVYDYTGSAAVNSVNITGTVGSFSVTDTDVITMATDASCTGENTQTVSCTVTPSDIDADLGGSGDQGTIQATGIAASFPITVRGGSGNDNVSVTAQFTSGTSTLTLDDSSGNDTLSLNGTSMSGINPIGYGIVSGGTGDDTVSGTNSVNGNGGNDTLRGISAGTSNVTLNGGTENDTFSMSDAPELANGGAGTDTVDFTTVGAVTVSLDTIQNDGVTGGGQNDNANADGLIEVVRTGIHTDSITGGTGNETFFAGDGNDTIIAGGGSDTIDGEGGADVMNGGSNGGAGDTVVYATRSGDLVVSLDTQPNDGEAGELDNLGADVENVIGGYGDDSINGSSGVNSLTGGPGNDMMEGRESNDILEGGPGDDKLDGGSQIDIVVGREGNDTLSGGPDNDTVDGDAGSDLVDGDSGLDVLSGGIGSDTLLSKDNQADTVNCGAATDHSVHDAAGDTINADCEISDTGEAGFGMLSIDSPAMGSPTGTTTQGGTTRLAVVTCSVSKKRMVQCTVALSDPKAGGTIKARLVRGDRTYGKAKRNGSGTLKLRAPKKAKAGLYKLVLTQNGRTVAKLKVRIR